MGSRRVVGYAIGEHHDAALAYGALAMAVAVRGGQVPGVIFHTDQGSEYTAQRFRRACERLSIRQSMGRPGSALDNAVIESWHSTLEWELRSVQTFATRAQARAAVAAWIGEYNTIRRSPGVLGPLHDVALKSFIESFCNTSAKCGARCRRCSEPCPLRTCNMRNTLDHRRR
jgi:transposase InsO family protein